MQKYKITKILITIIFISFFVVLPTQKADAVDTKVNAGDIVQVGDGVSMKYIGLVNGKRQFKMLKATVNKKSDKYLDTPFIPEYIKAMYEYGIIVITILATVMLIVAGLLWTISGGNTEQIGKAKKIIARSITGLVIAVGSYTLLYAINPQLVEFESLRILRVGEISNTQVTEENENLKYTASNPKKPNWEKGEFDCEKHKTTPYPPSGVVNRTELKTGTCPIGVIGKFTVVKEMHPAICEVGKKLNALNQGYKLKIHESWRSFETQVEYWCRDPNKTAAQKAAFTATPGYSNHGHGIAVDVKLLKNGKEVTVISKKGQCSVDPEYIRILAQAFYDADPKFRRLTSEIWHFEYGSREFVGVYTKKPGPRYCK